MNDDCEVYDPVYFDESLKSNKLRDYIDLNHPTDAFVSLSDYAANKEAYSEGVWVYVDAASNEQEQAYVYWSQALQPKERTSLILESLYYKKAFVGSFDHITHIDMEAVSEDDLSLWEELPKELEDDFGGSESWTPPITEKGDYIIDNYEWQVLFDADEPLWGMTDADHKEIVKELGLKEGDQLIATTSILEESDIDESIEVKINHASSGGFPAIFFYDRASSKGSSYNDYGYSGSQLKKAMDYFTDKLHKNTELEEVMKHAYPVNIKEEPVKSDNSIQPKYVNVIDRSAPVDAKGEAFILGVHEVNYLQLHPDAMIVKVSLTEEAKMAYHWLRSPVANEEIEVYSTMSDGIYRTVSLKINYLGLRPLCG